MLKILIYILTFLFLPDKLLAAADVVELSPAILKFIEFETNYNVAGRRPFGSTSAQLFVRRASGVYFKISDNNQPVDLAYDRFYLNRGASPNDVSATYQAIKVSGNNTYLVVSLGRYRLRPFFVKIRPEGTQSVRLTKFLMRDLADFKIAYLPEVAGNAHYDLKEGNTIRAFNPVNTVVGEHDFLYPAHGLLGSPYLSEVAKHAGFSNREEWIHNEYLPKIAKWNASLNYEVGIAPANHTQNFLIQLNEETGRISNLVLRDFLDIAVDPAIRALRGLPPYPPGGVATSSIVGRKHLDPDISGHTLGDIYSAYVWQSIAGILPNQDTAKSLAIFWEHYTRKVNSIVGVDLKLEVPTSQSGLATSVNRLRNLSFPIIYENHAFFGNSFAQQSLREIFESIRKKGFVFSLQKSPALNRLYIFDGQTILSIDATTRAPIEFVYGLTLNELELANEAVLMPRDCRRLFRTERALEHSRELELEID